MNDRLGELLIEHGKLDRERLDRALRLHEQTGERLEVLLVQLGFVAERDIAAVWATDLDLPVAQADEYPDTPALGNAVAPEFLREAQVVPLSEEEDRIVVAMADPLDRYAVNALRLATGKHIEQRVGVASEVEAALERQYGNGATSMDQLVENIQAADVDEDLGDIQHLKDQASEAPIIRLVSLVISRAVAQRASDIHIEPFEDKLKIRFRVDGLLKEVEAPPVRSSAAVISRIKVMANLNIAERRLPQDGRIRLRVEGREYDMRISTVPTLYGESVVLRILDRESVPLEFTALGFVPKLLAEFQEILLRPHGILLVTGPTGSGKTTTLYAALNALNTPEKKILTVEDPVEYQLEGINQLQIMPQIGLTFAQALRAFLRQDPDVIMVGEMRDLETAKIAVQAALTGHKVFSTLHTNDAPSSVTRLLDMGVEDYLLTATVNGVLAQRLVRKLCEHCREPYGALPELVEQLGLKRFQKGGDITLYRAQGCPDCNGTGYRGRTTILELLPMSDSVRQTVLNNGDADAIRRAALSEGMVSMYDNGLGKAVAGITTVEEVARVTREV